MDPNEFRESSHTVTNFIVDYVNTLTKSNPKVLTDVQPGYLQNMLNRECPEKGEAFEKIFEEFHEKIMPGVTHWNSPNFHGYFPAAFSYSTMIAELLIAGLNTVDVNWEACPASVELEIHVMNWLGKMLNIPKGFLSSAGQLGGGVLQTTSGEATLLSIVAARNCALKTLKLDDQNLTASDISSKLVCYASTEAHFSVSKTCMISGVRIHSVTSDSGGSLRGAAFLKAIKSDITQGLIPFCLVATLGTTTICSFDCLKELGPICKEYNIWMHVDAAYAGSALVCPEFRQISQGLEYAESFAVGLHKFMYMSYDVVGHWVKNTNALKHALCVDAMYIKDKYKGNEFDLQHMQIGTGRKFRSLKVWIVLKNYGVNGTQELIRRHVKLGKYMEQLIRQDGRFDIVSSALGVVTFALKCGNQATEDLRTLINDRGNIVLTPSQLHGKYVIRLVVNYSTREKDIEFAWNEVMKNANELQCLDIK